MKPTDDIRPDIMSKDVTTRLIRLFHQLEEQLDGLRQHVEHRFGQYGAPEGYAPPPPDFSQQISQLISQMADLQNMVNNMNGSIGQLANRVTALENRTCDCYGTAQPCQCPGEPHHPVVIPVITGQPIVGGLLHVTNRPASTSGWQFRWMRNGNVITGATGETYAVSTNDVGTMISVWVWPNGRPQSDFPVSHAIGPMAPAQNQDYDDDGDYGGIPVTHTFDLLASAFHGTMREGDTLGLANQWPATQRGDTRWESSLDGGTWTAVWFGDTFLLRPSEVGRLIRVRQQNNSTLAWRGWVPSSTRVLQREASGYGDGYGGDEYNNDGYGGPGDGYGEDEYSNDGYYEPSESPLVLQFPQLAVGTPIIAAGGFRNDLIINRIWQRSISGESPWQAIPGANGATFTPRPQDVGYFIRHRQDAFQASRMSPAVGPIPEQQHGYYTPDDGYMPDTRHGLNSGLGGMEVWIHAPDGFAPNVEIFARISNLQTTFLQGITWEIETAPYNETWAPIFDESSWDRLTITTNFSNRRLRVSFHTPQGTIATVPIFLKWESQGYGDDYSDEDYGDYGYGDYGDHDGGTRYGLNRLGDVEVWIHAPHGIIANRTVYARLSPHTVPVLIHEWEMEDAQGTWVSLHNNLNTWVVSDHMSGVRVRVRFSIDSGTISTLPVTIGVSGGDDGYYDDGENSRIHDVVSTGFGWEQRIDDIQLRVGDTIRVHRVTNTQQPFNVHLGDAPNSRMESIPGTQTTWPRYIVVPQRALELGFLTLALPADGLSIVFTQRVLPEGYYDDSYYGDSYYGDGYYGDGYYDDGGDGDGPPQPFSFRAPDGFVVGAVIELIVENPGRESHPSATAWESIPPGEQWGESILAHTFDDRSRYQIRESDVGHTIRARSVATGASVTSPVIESTQGQNVFFGPTPQFGMTLSTESDFTTHSLLRVNTNWFAHTSSVIRILSGTRLIRTARFQGSDMISYLISEDDVGQPLVFEVEGNPSERLRTPVIKPFAGTKHVFDWNNTSFAGTLHVGDVITQTNMPGTGHANRIEQSADGSNWNSVPAAYRADSPFKLTQAQTGSFIRFQWSNPFRLISSANRVLASMPNEPREVPFELFTSGFAPIREIDVWEGDVLLLSEEVDEPGRFIIEAEGISVVGNIGIFGTDNLTRLTIPAHAVGRRVSVEHPNGTARTRTRVVLPRATPATATMQAEEDPNVVLLAPDGYNVGSTITGVPKAENVATTCWECQNDEGSWEPLQWGRNDYVITEDTVGKRLRFVVLVYGTNEAITLEVPDVRTAETETMALDPQDAIPNVYIEGFGWGALHRHRFEDGTGWFFAGNDWILLPKKHIESSYAPYGADSGPETRLPPLPEHRTESCTELEKMRHDEIAANPSGWEYASTVPFTSKAWEKSRYGTREHGCFGGMLDNFKIPDEESNDEQ